MEENQLESLVEVPAIHFWAALTVDASFICVLRASDGCKEV
jgi:hypothetical protein